MHRAARVEPCPRLRASVGEPHGIDPREKTGMSGSDRYTFNGDLPATKHSPASHVTAANDHALEKVSGVRRRAVSCDLNEGIPLDQRSISKTPASVMIVCIGMSCGRGWIVSRRVAEWPTPITVGGLCRSARAASVRSKNPPP